MDADGLIVIDTTGVLTGNADIACERETPTPDPVKRLPGMENAAPLAMPWLTESRAFAAFYGLALVGVALAVHA